jgi:3-hydroxy-3-methylglutaryl CoA synthase
MVGVKSYGAYIPLYRIKREIIDSAMGWLNVSSLSRGEKAVANYNEDSITMAAAACSDCMSGTDREEIDGLYFATTTPVYNERRNAEVIASALDLRPDIQIADFTGSTRAGITALHSACDSIKAGPAKNVMVCASDFRLGKAGSSQEKNYGDGAAALLLDDGEDVIANMDGFYSVSYDFTGYQRAETDKFGRSWEDRWIRDVGYNKFITDAISGLLKKYNIVPENAAKVCYPCLYVRDHANIGKKLGFNPGQIQEHMFTSVGDTGTAYPLMIFVAALEEAKENDKIIVASFGDGSDAMLFETTRGIENIQNKRKGVKKHIVSKKNLDSYEKFVSFRNMLPVDKGIRGEQGPPVSSSVIWRKRRAIFGLVGSKCKRCGTLQYPPQRICIKSNCGAIDEMEDYRFSDKKGRLFTYTTDYLAYTPNPPAIYGVVDFDGGGRFVFGLTDCEPESLKVGMPVEMSFRRKFGLDERSGPNYFWEATTRQV